MAYTATFTSGSTVPTMVSSEGNIYLNKTTGIFYKYASSTWVALSNSYCVTAWQTMSLYSPYASTSSVQYRQQGTSVILNGYLTVNPSLGSKDLITTDQIIYKFSTNYLPIVNKYVSLYDNYGGIFGIGKIETNGDFTILGSKIPIDNTNIILDGVTFELI